MTSLCIAQYIFICPNTSFTTHCFNFYINNTYVTKVQLLRDSYVHKRSADIVWVLHIVINSIIEIYCIFPTIQILPNQELSVLYGGPTLNYGGQLSLYVLYMLPVNMTGDLAHLQLSNLQGETRSICRTSDLQGERMLICRT